MAKKSNKGKLMGIIGNAVTMIFAVCALALMALPMLAQIVPDVISGGSKRISLDSVFSYMGNVSDADGTSKGALVMFILVAIVASLLIVSAIVGLVGVFMGNKKLNMSLVNKILALVLVVVALVAMILTIAAAADGLFNFSSSIIPASTKTVADAGAVLPLVFGLFAVVGAFLTPSKKRS